MFDLKSKARDVIERGYCVLESVYDDHEQRTDARYFQAVV